MIKRMTAENIKISQLEIEVIISLRKLLSSVLVRGAEVGELFFTWNFCLFFIFISGE